MSIKIALVGNPNSGKTTLFNALTGMNQYVGNWPGVTVEKKEGKIKQSKDVTLTDLPGIYSLSPYTPEEIVARNYLTEEKPDAIINVVDGTNLERNLYLTTQLLEFGIPVVIAVNMMDIVAKKGDQINLDALSKELGCQMIEISALKNTGIKEVSDVAIAIANDGADVKKEIFDKKVECAIDQIEKLSGLNDKNARWHAVKLFERDKSVANHLRIDSVTLEKIDEIVSTVEKELDDTCESIITDNRYVYITALTKKYYSRSNKPSVTEKIDNIVTHRILALPIFFIVMLGVYSISIGTVGALVTDFMNEKLFGEWIIPGITSGLTAIGFMPWLVSLVADGIFGGIGAVLGFVPQMLILFLLLSLLEDCGYMSRVAFIMDRLFRSIGLSGKSFIPMLVASGCGVPGIMASRTIEHERDRRMTIMTTGFIPCGAKMPLVGLIAGALFGDSPLIATSAYFVGIGAVVISGIMLKKLKIFKGEPSPFVMELPQYHLPVASNILRTTWERGWGFIKRAGSVILVASVLIWTLNSLSFECGYITDGETGKSILENLGSIFAWIFSPLGFGRWETTVATILGLVAKEEIVGVFGTLSSMSELSSAYMVFGGSMLCAYTFMMFNLLCAPCFAAMGAIKKEMNNWKWTAFAIGYMTVFAYSVCLITYQLGLLFTGNGNVVGSIFAFILLGVFGYFIFRKEDFSIIDFFKKRFGKTAK